MLKSRAKYLIILHQDAVGDLTFMFIVFNLPCILRRGPVVILDMEYIQVFNHFQKLKVKQ